MYKCGYVQMCLRTFVYQKYLTRAFLFKIHTMLQSCIRAWKFVVYFAILIGGCCDYFYIFALLIFICLALFYFFVSILISQLVVFSVFSIPSNCGLASVDLPTQPFILFFNEDKRKQKRAREQCLFYSERKYCFIFLQTQQATTS